MLPGNQIEGKSSIRCSDLVLFSEALPYEIVGEIRACLQQQKALGTDRFHACVEARIRCFTAICLPE